MSKQTCDGCGIEHDPMDWHAELLHDEYACVREALQTARSKLSTSEKELDELAQHCDRLNNRIALLDDERTSLSSRLDSIRKACGAAVTNPVGAGLYASGYRDSAARVLNMMDDQNG